MNFLLDTCTFLWLILGSEKLSDTAREAFTNQDNEIYLSVISCLEISIKWSLGKLDLPVDPGQFLPKQRTQHLIEPLPLTEEATYHLSKLPILLLPNIRSEVFGNSPYSLSSSS